MVKFYRDLNFYSRLLTRVCLYVAWVKGGGRSQFKRVEQRVSSLIG